MISLRQWYAHPVVAATLRGLNPDLTCELEILQRGPVQEVGGQGGEAVVGQRQGHEAQRGRQHGGVNVLDMVAGQVEVAQ